MPVNIQATFPSKEQVRNGLEAIADDEVAQVSTADEPPQGDHQWL